jgi:TolB-like protein
MAEHEANVLKPLQKDSEVFPKRMTTTMRGQQFAFGPFLLDPERRVLLRGGEPVAVGHRGVLILDALLRKPGEVLTKAELIDAGWPDTTVEESNLSVQIATLRKALGQSPDGGEWIATIPRIGYRFAGRLDPIGRVDQGHWDIDDPLPPPGLRKPSIAVLPFANMSGDPKQDYFVDGIVEDITTALSHFRWLFVMARSTTFTFKGRSADVTEIGRELGVRYVLEGSVRRVPGRIRITAKLIDASTGAHLWADRFDGAFEDIFDLQDQVSTRVVGAIGPKLEQAEIERAKRKPTENLDAYDVYLRGLAKTVAYTQDGQAEGLRLFRRAIELDPEFAAAYGMAAWCRVIQRVNGWMIDRAAEVADGAEMARKAVCLANEDALAFCWGGFSLGFLAYELDDAIGYVDHALALNPNLAAAWYLLGHLRIYAGDPEAGIEPLTRAIELNPLDPLLFRVHAGLAYAHFFAGRNDQASAWAEKALRRADWLTALRIGAACHAVAGRVDQARKLVARMLELDPRLRISDLQGLPPLRRAEDFERWSEALRKAGLPE